MFQERRFEYLGPEIKTRGQYGIGLTHGWETEDVPGYISVWDPDFGWSVWISIPFGIACGEWQEETE